MFAVIVLEILFAMSTTDAQSYCYSSIDNPYRGYSTKTAYRDVQDGSTVGADDVKGGKKIISYEPFPTCNMSIKFNIALKAEFWALSVVSGLFKLKSICF